MGPNSSPQAVADAQKKLLLEIAEITAAETAAAAQSAAQSAVPAHSPVAAAASSFMAMAEVVSLNASTTQTEAKGEQPQIFPKKKKKKKAKAKAKSTGKTVGSKAAKVRRVPAKSRAPKDLWGRLSTVSAVAAKFPRGQPKATQREAEIDADAIKTLRQKLRSASYTLNGQSPTRCVPTARTDGHG